MKNSGLKNIISGQKNNNQNETLIDTPICISQFFVNKQNVRSFGNIIDTKLLRSEDDAVFFKHLFGEIILVRDLPQELHSILITLKSNLRSKSKQDFVGYFNIDKGLNLSSVNKEEIFICCYRALCDIIPKNFYGSNHNSKIFKNMVHTIIYSMKGQHMFLSKIINKWDTSTNPWKLLQKDGLDGWMDAARNILYHILIWIIRYILSAILSLNFYATTCKLDANEYKLHFFWKNQWQCFYDKKISNMIFSKVIKKFEPYCLGKKLKRNQSLSERLKLRILKKDIPKLHLVLKTGNDCRPIVRYKSEPISVTEKYKMKDRLNFLKLITGKSAQKIETQFASVYQEWLRSNKPKLYFVKTDLSNAFGSINKEKLLKIICEMHLNYQKAEKNAYMKKKIAQQYKDFIVELRRPLFVRAGSTVFEWKEGLVQGYKYSPALSELYYTYMDGIYFSELLRKSHLIHLFIRVVDDYLYITDSLEKAELFLKSLSSYRNVNYEKTVVNFPQENFKISQEITFLGYSYNTSTLEVSRANTVFVGQMCHKIAFTSAISHLSKFLENRIGQSGIQINGHIFNLHYDCEETIWKHIFTTFCLSANKFCTILGILCEEKEMRNYLILYKNRVTVKLSNAMIETLIKNKPKDYLFMYCINHFRYLSWLALCLCAKKTPKCNGLVPFINAEVAKTNCLFGKWREHSSRIDPNGDSLRSAVKDVCRRTDLRVIVKKFVTLPSGFECFHHKHLN